MAEVLRFFVQYEAALYFVLGLGGIVYFYRFWIAWQEVSSALYGLEREASRSRLNRATAALLVLLGLAVAVFIMVTFVATTLPAQALLATPTLDLALAAQQAGTAMPSQGIATGATATPLATVAIDPGACIPDRINITEPQSGDTISGLVQVSGTANVPDFGFYKFEVAPAEQALWLTIQAGRSMVTDGVLVDSWDTSRLPPGGYVIQLVITDSSGHELPACRIPINIGTAEQ